MINLNMQEVVTKELGIKGTYTYTKNEFEEVIELLSKGNINIDPIISKLITLDEAPEMFKLLADNPGELIKVVITI